MNQLAPKPQRGDVRIRRETLKKGMLVTAYTPGYWRILEIEKRPKENALVYVEQVAGEDGVELTYSYRREQCDASWCHPITLAWIEEHRAEETQKWERVRALSIREP